MMQSSPCLPPYAREAQLVDGWLWVYAGSKAWSLVGRGADCRAVVYPYCRDADEFRWPVQGLKVMVMGHDRAPAELEQLVRALLLAGAAEVWLQHVSLTTPELYTQADLGGRA